MRILFVSDEVTPFTNGSVTAELARILPEQLQESGDYEVRIMMPRYGLISERRNRLHEVIRLSGTNITIGSRSETLKVKVASIPGIRMQVYFMDNKYYFKRKGIYADKQGKIFEDNVERALFFGQASLETIRNLGWKPDVVHGFGWMSSFVPMLLQTTFASDPLFEEVKTIYTPNTVDFETPLSEDTVKNIGFPEGAQLVDKTPTDAGLSYADAAIFPPDMKPTIANTASFSDEFDEAMVMAGTIYEQVLAEVPA